VEITSCHLRMRFSSKWTPSFSTITGNGSLSTWCMSVKASIAYLTSFDIFFWPLVPTLSLHGMRELLKQMTVYGV